MDFKEVKRYWTLPNYKRNPRVHQALVEALYFCAMLLCNIPNCLYRNETSPYFKCLRRTLAEFLEWRD